MPYFLRLMQSKIRFLVICPIIILLCVTSFTIGMAIFTDIHRFSKLNTDGGGYSIIDQLDQPGKMSVFDFFEQEGALSQLKHMYALCKEQLGASYFVMTDQFLYTDRTDLPLKFSYGFGDVPDEEVDPSTLKSMQMNAAAIRGSSMDVAEGRLFDDTEFVYQEGQPVPVIAGQEYREYLQINDTFEVNYLGKVFPLKVIGFWEEGASAARGESFVLDRYIVMPALEFPDDPAGEEDYSFQMKVYLGHTNAFVYSSESVLRVENTLDQICREVGIQPYVLLAVYPVQIFHLGYATSNILLFVVFPSAILLLAAVLLCFLRWRKTKSLLANVEFHHRGELLRFIAAIYLETLVWIGAAGIISAVFLSTVLYFLHINLFVLLGTLLFLWLILPLPTGYKLYRLYSKGKRKLDLTK